MDMGWEGKGKETERNEKDGAHADTTCIPCMRVRAYVSSLLCTRLFELLWLRCTYLYIIPHDGITRRIGQTGQFSSGCIAHFTVGACFCEMITAGDFGLSLR